MLLLALAACTTAPVASHDEQVVPRTALAARIAAEEAAALGRGLALRDRYGLPKPLGATAIQLFASSKHEFSFETSTILYQDADGAWQRDRAVEVGPGMLRQPTRLESHEVEALTADEAAALERLIRDRALYRRAPPEALPASPGGETVIRIDTRFGHATRSSYDGMAGAAGELARIAAG